VHVSVSKRFLFQMHRERSLKNVYKISYKVYKISYILNFMRYLIKHIRYLIYFIRYLINFKMCYYLHV